MSGLQSRDKLRALIVGHDAYRAGAQLILLDLLRYVRRKPETGIDCELLLLGEGELLSEFRSEWPTTVWDRRLKLFTPDRVEALRNVALLENAVLRPVRERLSRRAALRRVARAGPYDVVFLNSAESLPIVPMLRPLVPSPMICQVLELSSRLHQVVLDRVSPHIERFVVVSKAVGSHLATRGIDPARMSLVYSGIPDPAEVPPPQPSLVHAVRRSLSIPDDAFVVGACGTLGWRKGSDIFVQVAAALARTNSGKPLHFVWIGADLESREAAQLRFDVERLGVADVVHFVATIPDTFRYMSILDVFFLSSREDPFPLVSLEAASLGLPIVYFAESGGTLEFAGADAGLAVPYLDVAAAADAIHRLATTPNLRADLGRRAKAKVAGYSVDTMATRILDILRTVARPPARLADSLREESRARRGG